MERAYWIVLFFQFLCYIASSVLLVVTLCRPEVPSWVPFAVAALTSGVFGYLVRYVQEDY
jgi:hypothetical protein